jgi:3-phosphoshikimate 1-carboxyvinyltransferase
MFGSIAEGETRIRNFLDGGDCRSTVQVMRALGVEIETATPTDLVVQGRGLDGLQEPVDVLDCGNSGTTIRLLLGLLAGQKFATFLTGTAQIRRRPMGRVVRPLRGMGADIMGRQNGDYAPLGIRPSRLRGVEYDMPVASGQVKSCVVLAGLYSQGLTVVREPGPARDHTERMLAAMGAPVYVYGRKVTSERPDKPLSAVDITVPGDISSAAFLLAAGAIVPGSHITIRDVGINPTRTGIVEALQAMGAQITYHNERIEGGEPVADLEVCPGELHGATFGGELIVTMIDELPMLAVVASQAHGRTVVRDASELRVKETDRIATTVSELRKMGAKIEPTSDGFVVDGPTPLIGAPVEAHGDHRLAMAMTIAGLAARKQAVVYGSHVTADSFPGFDVTLQALGARLQVDQ